MEFKTVLLIVAIVIAVLFIPLYPLKIIKKILLFLVNKFLPLPIKFEDIGGIPLISMRLYKVQLPLGGGGTLDAEEMHLRINFWRVLTFKQPADPRHRYHFWRWVSLHRPAIDPLSFYKPVIRISSSQIKDKGEVWFLLPLTAMKWFVSTLFMSLWGLNYVRIYRGTIIISGKPGRRKSETIIEDLAGEFTSHGQTVKVRRLSCGIGDGSLEIHYPRTGPLHEGRLSVRKMRLEALSALKVPRILSGPVDIDAVITGTVADLEMSGHISSSMLMIRTEPILDFRSPMRLKGTELILEHMQGRVGEYLLEGSLTTDVETDISDLRLKGRGVGRASQSILKMLSLKPFIEYADLEADVSLKGDLNEFEKFSADITLHLKNAGIDFTQVGEGTMKDFPLKQIPEAHLHLLIDQGTLIFDRCSARADSFSATCDGKIVMFFHPELDKVYRSEFDLEFSVDCPDIQAAANLFSLEKYDFSGSTSAEFKLECNYGFELQQGLDLIYSVPVEMSDAVLQTIKSYFFRLDGFGRLSAQNIRLSGIPLRDVKAVKLPVELSFDELGIDFVLEKERFRWENGLCRSKWFSLTLEGGIGFFDKQLLLEGEISATPEKLRESRLFKLIPASESIAKRIRKPFHVSGNTNELTPTEILRQIFRF